MLYGVHGRSEEESDGFVDVLLCGDGGELELCEGFGDTDDGFELTDCDWDRGSLICVHFCLAYLLADGDEVG